MHQPPLDIPFQFETERLFLRWYQPGDAAWYYPVSQRNKSHLAQYESENALMKINTEEEAEILVRYFIDSWTAKTAFYMAAFRKSTQEFVAQIYIGVVNWDLPELEIGYFADVDHQGSGFVTEAAKRVLDFIFEEMGAYRVRLECDDTNWRSYRVAERCGFVREGHIRENKRNRDGSISGTLHYGLLKREFEALPWHVHLHKE